MSEPKTTAWWKALFGFQFLLFLWPILRVRSASHRRMSGQKASTYVAGCALASAAGQQLLRTSTTPESDEGSIKQAA